MNYIILFILLILVLVAPAHGKIELVGGDGPKEPLSTKPTSRTSNNGPKPDPSARPVISNNGPKPNPSDRPYDGPVISNNGQKPNPSDRPYDGPVISNNGQKPDPSDRPYDGPKPEPLPKPSSAEESCDDLPDRSKIDTPTKQHDRPIPPGPDTKPHEEPNPDTKSREEPKPKPAKPSSPEENIFGTPNTSLETIPDCKQHQYYSASTKKCEICPQTAEEDHKGSVQKPDCNKCTPDFLVFLTSEQAQACSACKATGSSSLKIPDLTDLILEKNSSEKCPDCEVDPKSSACSICQDVLRSIRLHCKTTQTKENARVNSVPSDRVPSKPKPSFVVNVALAAIIVNLFMWV